MGSIPDATRRTFWNTIARISIFFKLSGAGIGWKVAGKFQHTLVFRPRQTWQAILVFRYLWGCVVEVELVGLVLLLLLMLFKGAVEADCSVLLDLDAFAGSSGRKGYGPALSRVSIAFFFFGLGQLHAKSKCETQTHGRGGLQDPAKGKEFWGNRMGSDGCKLVASQRAAVK